MYPISPYDVNSIRKKRLKSSNETMTKYSTCSSSSSRCVAIAALLTFFCHVRRHAQLLRGPCISGASARLAAKVMTSHSRGSPAPSMWGCSWRPLSIPDVRFRWMTSPSTASLRVRHSPATVSFCLFSFSRTCWDLSSPAWRASPCPSRSAVLPSYSALAVNMKTTLASTLTDPAISELCCSALVLLLAVRLLVA